MTSLFRLVALFVVDAKVPNDGLQRIPSQNEKNSLLVNLLTNPNGKYNYILWIMLLNKAQFFTVLNRLRKGEVHAQVKLR